MSGLSFTAVAPVGLINASRLTALIGGYAGRSEADVRAHIDELAKLGVKPPPDVPMFYPIPTDLLTTEPEIGVTAAQTSGEVEPVVILQADRVLLGVGSDHTDRALERDDVLRAKLACPKPVCPTFFSFASWAEIDWDRCHVRSWVDGELYQDGSLNGLRHPDNLLGVYQARTRRVAKDVLVFGGTIPLLNGRFEFGRCWRIALDVPGHGTLTHTYTIKECL